MLTSLVQTLTYRLIPARYFFWEGGKIIYFLQIRIPLLLLIKSTIPFQNTPKLILSPSNCDLLHPNYQAHKFYQSSLLYFLAKCQLILDLFFRSKYTVWNTITRSFFSYETRTLQECRVHVGHVSDTNSYKTLARYVSDTPKLCRILNNHKSCVETLSNVMSV